MINSSLSNWLDLSRTDIDNLHFPENFKKLNELSLFASPRIDDEKMLAIRKAVPNITEPVEYISDLIAAKGKKTGETGKVLLCKLPEGDGEVELHWEKYLWRCRAEYLGIFFYNGEALKAKEGLQVKIMKNRNDWVNNFEEKDFVSKPILCTYLIEYSNYAKIIDLQPTEEKGDYSYYDFEHTSESIPWMNQLGLYSEYKNKRFEVVPSSSNPPLDIPGLCTDAPSGEDLFYEFNLDNLTLKLIRGQSFDKTH